MRDNVPSTMIRYGLDGPGIESWHGHDFPHRIRPALGPNHPLVQWVSGDFWGVERPGRGVNHPDLAPRLKKE
jgi:hypothetical protein